MKELILGIWLGVQGCVDFKYKEIPLWFSILGAIIGIIFCFAEKRALGNVLLSCVPGVAALVFSRLTKEIMGYGDGIVLVVMGIYLSLEHLISIGITAFTIAGVAALILLVVFQKKGSYRIPFIPFLSMAYGIEYLMKLGENGG